MTSKLLAFFLMTAAAFGQAVCVTNQNNVGMPLGPLQHPAIGLERGTELRHNNYAFDGSGPVDLGASFVKYEIVSGPTMSISRTNVTYTATILGPGLTQVIITPTIPAGQYYTKFIQYQANNSNYLRTLSWDTLTVTNPPSAGGITMDAVSLSLVPLIPSNGFLGTGAAPWQELNVRTGRFGKIYAGSLDVDAGVSAADTGAVKLVGSTWQGPMTGEYDNTLNLLSSTNYQAENLRGNALPSLNARLLTGIDYASITNPPPLSGGGGVTFYTNGYGQIVYTNGSGYQVVLDGAELPTGDFAWFRNYSSLDVTTSTHIGGWAFTTTNGMALITSPYPESVNVPRMVELMRIPDEATNGYWRTGVKVVGLPSVSADSAVVLRFALGSGMAATQSWNLVSLYQGNGDWGLYGYSPAQIGAGGSWSSSTGNQTNPTFIAANPNNSPLSFRGMGRGDSFWILQDYNGTNLLRGGLALDNAGLPFLPYQQMGKTNAAPASWVGISFMASTLRHQPVTFAIKSFFLQTNQLWWPAP